VINARRLISLLVTALWCGGGRYACEICEDEEAHFYGDNPCRRHEPKVMAARYIEVEIQ
jgi:hypothetical protein